MTGKQQVAIGLLGAGTVGSAVASTLALREREFAGRVGAPVVVRRVAVRDLAKPRHVAFPAGMLTDDAEAVATDPGVDIVVELIGGEEPAGSLIRSALAAGKHVVTANKELIAKSGPELLGLARAQGVDLHFEASVGGGIPLIAPLQRDLIANEIRSISAIINGTTNYILTRMAQDGASFRDALAEAQQLGYAEADPTNDVEGTDAAYKLAIMASLGFRTRVEPAQVYREGISNLEPRDFLYAEELGYAIKLIATAERTPDGILPRVVPALVHQSLPLAKVDGVFNAVEVQGDLVGRVTFQGAGAGPGPTASAVLADTLAVARRVVHGGAGPGLAASWAELPVLPLGVLQTRYYVRVVVADRPGVLAQIARILGDHDVSIAAVTQKEAYDDEGTAELVITTHASREDAVQDALRQVVELPVVARLAQVLRIEG